MSSASHRGVDGPIVTGQMASAFMSNRDDDVADILLQTDRDRLSELHAEVIEPSANALPVTPVRAGRQNCGRFRMYLRKRVAFSTCRFRTPGCGRKGFRLSLIIGT